jgi:hypothetical protein
VKLCENRSTTEKVEQRRAFGGGVSFDGLVQMHFHIAVGPVTVAGLPIGSGRPASSASGHGDWRRPDKTHADCLGKMP